MQPRYTSSVSLLLDPQRPGSFGSEGQFVNALVDGTKIASVVSIIESSELLLKVVASEHLADDPEFNTRKESFLRTCCSFLPFLKSPVLKNDPETRTQTALSNLIAAVRVERVGVTYVLNVAVTSGRPQTSQRLAAAVVNAYLDGISDSKAEANRRDGMWLANQLSDVRRKLAEAEESAEVIRQKYGFLETGERIGTGVDRQTLTELTRELEQATADLAGRRARYEQVQRLRSSDTGLESLPEVSSSAVFQNLLTKQNELAQQLVTLRAVYHDTAPAVQRVVEERREIGALISAEISRIVEGMRIEMEAAATRESALRARLTAMKAGQEASPKEVEGRVQLRDAERLVDADRGLYESLVARWREVQQQTARVEPEARVISQAFLPGAPSWPKPLLLPAAGGAIFLLLGTVGLLAPTILDKRIVSPTAFENQFGLPVLGAIPLVQKSELKLVGGTSSIVDYSIRKPMSRFAESFRSARAYLQLSGDQGPRIIQVTSAVPGEGKSTVAAAMAVSAAAAGIRTVLVDVDVRFSAISSMFGIEGEPGLADILWDGASVESVLQTNYQPRLAVIGAGSIRRPQPDMVLSDRLSALVRDLSQSFSLVILDCPPALAVSDALIASRCVAETVLVVEWRSTAKDVINEAIKALWAVDAPLTGIILNKVNLSKLHVYSGTYQKYNQAIYKYFGT